jgi:hypothetical protein
MPNRHEHRKFDKLLVEKGVIRSDKKAHIVHNKMDSRCGRNHRELDCHSVDGVKERLGKLDDLHWYNQRDLTDALRIAAGHVALDQTDGDFDRALRIMRRQGWDRIRYRRCWQYW